MRIFSLAREVALLRVRRHQLGLPEAWVEAAVGLPRGRLSEVEHGRRAASFVEVAALRRLYRMAWAEFEVSPP